MHTILINDMVFSSPTVNYPPMSCPSIEENPPEPELLRDLKKLQWAVACYPQAAYCAWDTPFTGPILGRLKVSFRHIPLHRVRNSWMLSPSVARSWQSLESALIWMAEFLLGNCPVLNQRLLPLEFKVFRPPSRFGYLGGYEDELHCRSCVMRSRDAFVPLMALCTMAIATWSRRITSPTSIHEDAFPDWGMALKAQGVGIDWIADLMASPITDLTSKTRRVGTLIRGDGPNLWWAQLPCMIRYSVPIWIYWGTVAVPALIPKASRAILAFRPNQIDIDNGARFIYELSADENTQDEHPLVENGSGQLHGETWSAMFARRQTENEKLNNPETAPQAEARLDQANSLPSNPLGLATGADSVFEWVECMEPRYRGKFVRHRVPRWQIGEVWDRYAENQRRYDEFRREWDLCRFFDTHSADDQEYYASQDGESSVFDINNVSSFLPSAENCNDASRQAHAASRPDNHPPTSDAFALAVSIGESMLRDRYGFIFPTESSYTLKFQPLLSSTKVEKIFGFCPKSLPNTLHEPLSDFATGLIRNSDNLQIQWDIRARGRNILEDNPRTRAIPCRRVGRDGRRELVYKIEVQDTVPGNWDLIIEDPVTVVQLLRIQGSQTTQSLLEYLVKQGSSCSTVYFDQDTDFSVQDMHTLNSATSRMATLGWIPTGYQFDISNYRHYEYKRDQLLQSRYGRAAWLSGGIIWRLAVEAMGLQPGFSGPSPLVYQYGEWHEYEGRGIGGDDSLSEEEEGIICGLYKVYTDQSGRQTEDASWWPKQCAWKRGGLYAGYWTADCERWFQTRLTGIRARTKYPKNAGDWKDALKYYQNDTRTILVRLSQGAEEILV